MIGRGVKSVLVGLSALGVCASAARAEPSAPPDPWEKTYYLDGVWKYRAGDSAAWASPAYSDAAWDSARLIDAGSRVLVPRDSIGWFRVRVELPASGEGRRPLAIQHMPATPQEIRWDGVLIERSGTVSPDAARERAGDHFFAEIPRGLSGPGGHLMAMRLSFHNSSFFPTPLYVRIGEATEVELAFYREAVIMMFLAGVFVFGAIYRYLNYRASGYGQNSLLFSLFVFSCSLYIILQYLWAFVDLTPETWRLSRVLLGVAWYFMISMVPDYFIFADSFPYKWVQKALLIGGFCVAFPLLLIHTGNLPFHSFNLVYGANKLFTYGSIGVSAWIIAWAAWRKQTGSSPALLGILCLLAGVIGSWVYLLDWAWAAGVGAHVLCLARAQSLKMSERMRRHQETDLRSARLEIELLKKNIQPHFLLNSLNSIIAWLEEDPKTATRLVNALADELTLLLKISAEKLIPLEEELRLCGTHLQVMGLRQDKSYRLEHRGLRGDEHLPPMVLHTLVENGLTHGYIGKRKGEFVLTRTETAAGARFALFNDGTPAAKGSVGGEGTGLRYVRSRLEEAFPGRWSLDSRPVAGGWEVAIEIGHGKA